MPFNLPKSLSNVYIIQWISLYVKIRFEIIYKRVVGTVKLNVMHLLEKKGKTKYWLYKQMGMSYQNFQKMITNQTSSIKYSNIEALCQIFECTPNDLFIFEDE
ncbi:MAG: putative transcriptional regulator [Clostridiales bacterium]|nr:putative transcriptional regulator [Clostridiales bacterium]